MPRDYLERRYSRIVTSAVSAIINASTDILLHLFCIGISGIYIDTDRLLPKNYTGQFVGRICASRWPCLFRRLSSHFASITPRQNATI
jgi:hypothetical protein